MEKYQEEYAAFIKEYERGTTDGERVGEIIARLAQYFSNKNITVGNKKIALNKIAVEIVLSFDDDTGKPISVSKANMKVNGTPEAEALSVEETHLKNIEQFINALKYLQKGLLNEYSHLGGN